MSDWAQLCGGGLLLYFGAEWLVGGSSALALALRVPQLIVGLTVVAYGTSAPEIVVGMDAARSGHGEVALGNVIGSNIANLGLILGAAALIRPARVDGALRRRELPMLIGSTALLPLMLLDGQVSRFEGAGLLLGAIVYTAAMVRAARGASARASTEAARAAEAAADQTGAPQAQGWRRAAIIATVGLAVLLVGGDLFVAGAIGVAEEIGMSERVVGLTVVAIGTSVPELVTALIAARHGHSDLAVGNVVGSNIFNCLLCLGSAALLGAVGASLSDLFVDLFALLFITALVAVFLRSERVITRGEGAAALASYLLFAVVTVGRG